MLSFPATYNAPLPARQPSPLPRRSDSLASNIVKPKPTSPLIQSKEDVKFARVVLETSNVPEEDVPLDEEERERRRKDRERELIEMLGRMTGWVEELTSLLQQAYKNQTELETALTLTRSNLQLALANNEMLEEALKRGGGKDIGWRRWSEREGVRRTSSVKEYVQHDRPNSVAEVPPHPQSASSRFFNFKSPLQRISSTGTSPTTHVPANSMSPPQSASASTPSLLPSISIPSTSSRSPSPVPVSATPCTPGTTASSASSASSSRTPSPISPSERERELATLLEKERKALKTVASEKAQLEAELESLSQALFEEANKMVSVANRKLAETEEELRIATDQREALKGALRIVEGENGTLRGGSTPTPEGHAEMRQRQGREGLLPPESQPTGEDSTHALQQTYPRPSPSNTPPTIPIPSVTVTNSDSTGSHWSPVTPTPDIPLPDESSTSVSSSRETSNTSSEKPRWSMMPKTPRSRSNVKSEFEQAMRRMKVLVGEDGDEDEEAEAGSEGLLHEEVADGMRNPPVGSARGSGRSSESDVEAELRPRKADPWTS